MTAIKRTAFIVAIPLLALWGCTVQQYGSFADYQNIQCEGNVHYKQGSIHNTVKPNPSRCTIFVYDDGIYATAIIDIGDGDEHVPSTWIIKEDGVYIDGELGTYTAIMFDELERKNPPVKTMILGDVPGSWDDEVVMPTIMRIYDAGYNTHLTATSHVASGGTDFFTGGVKRTFESGAKVGIHSWGDFDRDGADYPKDHPAHTLYLNLYRHVGVVDDFYWLTLDSAPADDIYYMTDAEIRKYLTTE